jgi:uncharacterized ferritin-like protein (DUF455 family)
MPTSPLIYLPGGHTRARWMRMDSARILKRFFFCERALIIAQSGWLASIADFETKLTLPQFSWQDAVTAHALRGRVFELRFPSRLMEEGDDAPLVGVFNEAINAPGPQAFILALARVYKPALLAAYEEYAGLADPLTDGPLLPTLRAAIGDKATQIATLTRFAGEMLRRAPQRGDEAEAWASALSKRLNQAGGLSTEEPRSPEQSSLLPGRKEFELAQVPARDERFYRCRYYWPDIIDPNFGYGEGYQLQLRSAVSHLNEVWAVETGGAVLEAFADELEWEFIYDAARWTYDESRHTRMGYERLSTWGYDPQEMPLGTHIYDSARGQDPIIRLGMLHYFETKNIGKKPRRASAFASYQDRMSQHDMDFDWADETIHAAYGHRWLDALRQAYPDRVPEIDTIRERCDALVAAEVAAATPEERADTARAAAHMLQKAERVHVAPAA